MSSRKLVRRAAPVLGRNQYSTVIRHQHPNGAETTVGLDDFATVVAGGVIAYTLTRPTVQKAIGDIIREKPAVVFGVAAIVYALAKAA